MQFIDEYVQKRRKKVFRVGKVLPGTEMIEVPDGKGGTKKKPRSVVESLERISVENVGILVAGKGDDGVIRIGWSKCSKLDKFDSEKGREIAQQRAMKIERGPYATSQNIISTNAQQDRPQIPDIVEKAITGFVERAMRYFKSDKVLIPKSPPRDIATQN